MISAKQLVTLFSSLLYLVIWLVNIPTFIDDIGIFFGLTQILIFFLMVIGNTTLYIKKLALDFPSVIYNIFSLIFMSNGFLVVLTSINAEIPLQIYSVVLSITSSHFFASTIYFSMFFIAFYGNLTITKELRKNSRKNSRFSPFPHSYFESFSKDDQFANYTVLLPAYNEEKEIKDLLSELVNVVDPFNILVIDNNSTDRTVEIATKMGVTVISERKQGKANAFKTGLSHINNHEKSKFVIMMDADGTYSANDIKRFIKVLNENRNIDVVIGSRLRGDIEPGAMPIINKIGNYILSFIARELYGYGFSDICSGFWGFSSDAVTKLLEVGIEASGFGLEAEMVATFSKKGIPCGEVPISYFCRKNSEAKLNPIIDGSKILSVLIRQRLKRK